MICAEGSIPNKIERNPTPLRIPSHRGRMAYDAMKENPGYILWNVVGVETQANEWNIRLVGRDKPTFATARIRKKTLAELQEDLLALKGFSAGEDCGISIVNRGACYQTEVCVYTASESYLESRLKAFNGLENNVMFAGLKKEIEWTRETYGKLKALPALPLENPVNSTDPLKCYFGLPVIVYMHLVGQLSTKI